MQEGANVLTPSWLATVFNVSHQVVTHSGKATTRFSPTPFPPPPKKTRAHNMWPTGVNFTKQNGGTPAICWLHQNNLLSFLGDILKMWPPNKSCLSQCHLVSGWFPCFTMFHPPDPTNSTGGPSTTGHSSKATTAAVDQPCCPPDVPLGSSQLSSSPSTGATSPGRISTTSPRATSENWETVGIDWKKIWKIHGG